jgi:hypothetical protein
MWLGRSVRDARARPGVRLVEPELIVDPDLRLMPLALRFAGKLNRVTEFLRMRAVG